MIRLGAGEAPTRSRKDVGRHDSNRSHAEKHDQRSQHIEGVGKPERETNNAHDLAPEFAGLTSVSSLVAVIFLSHFVAKRKTEKVDLFGHRHATALTISGSLAQIGEFSFILAALATRLTLLPESGRNLILAGAIISILLNPLIFAALDRLSGEAGARAGRGGGGAREGGDTDPRAGAPDEPYRPCGADRPWPRRQLYQRGAGA